MSLYSYIYIIWKVTVDFTSGTNDKIEVYTHENTRRRSLHARRRDKTRTARIYTTIPSGLTYTYAEGKEKKIRRNDLQERCAVYKENRSLTLSTLCRETTGEYRYYLYCINNNNNTPTYTISVGFTWRTWVHL